LKLLFDKLINSKSKNDFVFFLTTREKISRKMDQPDEVKLKTLTNRQLSELHQIVFGKLSPANLKTKNQYFQALTGKVEERHFKELQEKEEEVRNENLEKYNFQIGDLAVSFDPFINENHFYRVIGFAKGGSIRLEELGKTYQTLLSNPGYQLEKVEPKIDQCLGKITFRRLKDGTFQKNKLQLDKYDLERTYKDSLYY
jgi:hypothetical protein